MLSMSEAPRTYRAENSCFAKKRSSANSRIALTLVRGGDDAARESRAGVAGGIRQVVVGRRMDDDRGAVRVEQAVLARERHARHEELKAVLARRLRHDARHVARVMSGGIAEAVLRAVRIEMGASRSKSRWLAGADRMKVNAVRTETETGNGSDDEEASRRVSKVPRADVLARGIDQRGRGLNGNDDRSRGRRSDGRRRCRRADRRRAIAGCDGEHRKNEEAFHCGLRLDYDPLRRLLKAAFTRVSA